MKHTTEYKLLSEDERNRVDVFVKRIMAIMKNYSAQCNEIEIEQVAIELLKLPH